MIGLVLFIAYFGFSLTVLYRELPAQVWEGGSIIYVLLATIFFGFPWASILPIIGIFVLLRAPTLRVFIADYMFKHAKKSIPRLSKTEEEALNRGDVWFEEGIFRGEPDFDALMQVETALTDEEQAFLTHETETLCAMLDDWAIVTAGDLPPSVWTYLKEKGFFGLVIAKEYGGKGFSARAHSDIIVKIASRSGSAAVTVMVPNSLGPGELLHHYGTAQQKSHYLPRLAKGLDIPCFALTEPGAGSDATSIESEAIVVRKKIDGKMVLSLQISLEKRWITLAPVATLIGLAVNLKDPEGLLSGEGQEGITCLLIARDTPHLEIGQRHLPAGQAFMNGTLRGKDIFVPIDAIIGGQAQAGHGWAMLVECLSIGRSISLPALATASSSIAYAMTGAYASVRRQFNVELAQFEGVQEKLAEIAGLNYMIAAVRELTLAAVNAGKKPSVASAITKYFNTELARITVNHAMDVHGGRAVVLGPRNYLAGLYQSIPISITVEGANIMTRNLLIFGQGSMACHPFVRDEFYAIANEDGEAFQTLFWQHVMYFLRNFAKTVCSVWTGGRLIKVPQTSLKREYQRLSRLSFAFAWLADLALLTLGGQLKRKERVSARLADALSYLYIALSVLRFCQKGDDAEQTHAKWALTYCFAKTTSALIALCENFPVRFIGKIARYIAFPFGTVQDPKDTLSHTLATLMCENNAYRLGLMKNISMDISSNMDKVENAFQLILRHAPLYQKVPELKRCKREQLQSMLLEKVANHVISHDEMETILMVEAARWDAIMVDEFSQTPPLHHLTGEKAHAIHE